MSKVVPAVPVGATATIEVSETSVKSVAAVGPNSTFVAPVKPVPVIVTVLPPSVGPEEGLTDVTAGTPPVVVVVPVDGAVVDDELPWQAASATAASVIRIALRMD